MVRFREQKAFLVLFLKCHSHALLFPKVSESNWFPMTPWDDELKKQALLKSCLFVVVVSEPFSFIYITIWTWV